MQEYARNIKGDIEVYAGFYVIASIVLGGNTVIGAFFYWQMMRIRYMLSPPL